MVGLGASIAGSDWEHPSRRITANISKRDSGLFSMIRIKAVCLWSCLSGPAFLCNIPAQSRSLVSSFDRFYLRSLHGLSDVCFAAG